MESVLICRDGHEDSVLGNLALARAIARAGSRATVVFAGDALAALDRGTFEWAYNFRGREARMGVIRQAEAAGLKMASARDPRWSDVRALVRACKGEENIRLLACPLWADFLDVSARVDYLERIDEAQLVDLLARADKVIGGY